MSAEAEPKQRTEPASATINRNANGDVIGAPLFLGTTELDTLDLDLNNQHEITFWVEDGVIHVSPANRSSVESHE